MKSAARRDRSQTPPPQSDRNRRLRGKSGEAWEPAENSGILPEAVSVRQEIDR
jgi:hypothetical protein